ncbi:MAG TPA: HAD-IIB family hydrolase [Selenomonadales bacterium]|nr:HAD-IIB family hydrolase [Selenomonadales bacterium]
MKTYKDFILVTDIDGTLANSEHKVSERNKEAIACFVAGGGHFAVATGRTQKNVVPYIEGLAVNAPCILYNGGALFSWQEQRFLKTRPLAGADVALFLTWCIARFPQMCIQVFTREQLYVITDPANVDEHMVREKQEFAYAALEDIVEKTWIKVILCAEHDDLLAARDLLSSAGLDAKTNNFFSALTYLEIVDKRVSKGNMLGEFRNIEAFRGKTLVAAGDFHNDIEMLRIADWGIAPANAHDDVRKIADIIAVSNDDDLMHDIICRVMPGL